MIYDYDGLTYHVYSAPNFEGDGNGGIYNNSYRWFTPKMRQDVDNPDPDYHLRSQITEWGWNPDVINEGGTSGSSVGCDYTQNSVWPTRPRDPNNPNKVDCKSNDERTHTFEDDINTFINTPIERRSAETINVWLVKRGSNPNDPNNSRADGLYADGTKQRWLSNYQASNP